MSTHREVAEWMLKQQEEERYLYQEKIVFDIEDEFGEEFTYINDNGNPAINRNVLREFRKLTEGTAVWERGERMWRHRESYDPPGKRQAD